LEIEPQPKRWVARKQPSVREQNHFIKKIKWQQMEKNQKLIDAKVAIHREEIG